MKLSPAEQVRSYAKRLALLPTQSGVDKSLLVDEYTEILMTRTKGPAHALKIVEQAKLRFDFAPTTKELVGLIESQPTGSVVPPNYDCPDCKGAGWRKVHILRTAEHTSGSGRTWRSERVTPERGQTALEFVDHLRRLEKQLDPALQMLYSATERCGCDYGRYLGSTKE